VPPKPLRARLGADFTSTDVSCMETGGIDWDPFLEPLGLVRPQIVIDARVAAAVAFYEHLKAADESSIGKEAEVLAAGLRAGYAAITAHLDGAPAGAATPAGGAPSATPPAAAAITPLTAAASSPAGLPAAAAQGPSAAATADAHPSEHPDMTHSRLLARMAYRAAMVKTEGEKLEREECHRRAVEAAKVTVKGVWPRLSLDDGFLTTPPGALTTPLRARLGADFTPVDGGHMLTGGVDWSPFLELLGPASPPVIEHARVEAAVAFYRHIVSGEGSSSRDEAELLAAALTAGYEAILKIAQLDSAPAGTGAAAGRAPPPTAAAVSTGTPPAPAAATSGAAGSPAAATSGAAGSPAAAAKRPAVSTPGASPAAALAKRSTGAPSAAGSAGASAAPARPNWAMLTRDLGGSGMAASKDLLERAFRAAEVAFDRSLEDNRAVAAFVPAADLYEIAKSAGFDALIAVLS